jgi:hypothetical protein
MTRHLAATCKKHGGALVATAGLILLTFTGAAMDITTPAYAVNSPAPVAPNSEFRRHHNDLPWERYTSQDGRFSIVYPGQPIQERDGIEVDGGVLPMTTTFVELWEGEAAFLVIDIDYRELVYLTPDAMLEASVASLKETYDEARAFEHPVHSGPFEGRELLLLGGRSLNMAVRVFFANGIGYHVMVSTTPGFPIDPRDIDRFLNSFQIESE